MDIPYYTHLSYGLDGWNFDIFLIQINKQLCFGENDIINFNVNVIVIG